MNVKRVLTKIIYYSKPFNNLLELNINGLILDSIKVYSLKNYAIENEVDFFIRKKNENIIIYPFSNADCFIIAVERIVNANKITIEAKDYIDVINENGNITFTF